MGSAGSTAATLSSFNSQNKGPTIEFIWFKSDSEEEEEDQKHSKTKLSCQNCKRKIFYHPPGTSEEEWKCCFHGHNGQYRFSSLDPFWGCELCVEDGCEYYVCECCWLHASRKAEFQDSPALVYDPNKKEVGEDGLLPFPKFGVKLSFLIEFITICGGRQKLQGLTTKEVCDNFVIPATETLQSSYCELMIFDKNPSVGIGTVFISHAWKFVFLDVVDALFYHFAKDLEVVIWFDMFSNNQWAAPSLPFTWWATTFRSAIEQFGRTVMVLLPWENPIPLTRAWCLWELYCTVDTKSTLEFALGNLQRQKFLKAILTISAEKVLDMMLSNIDVRKSEAKPDDVEKIFNAIRSTCGFDLLNRTAKAEIGEWVARTVEKGTQIGSWQAADIATIIGSLGNLYQRLGKYDKAETFKIQEYKHFLKAFGEDNLNTIVCKNNIGQLYWSQGKYDQAEPIFKESIAKLRRLVKEDNPTLIAFINNLAQVYTGQGKFEQAEPLFLECLARIKNSDPRFIEQSENVASFYLKQDKFDQAKPIVLDLYHCRKEDFGEKNRLTLQWYATLGRIYRKMGDYSLAEEILRNVWETRRDELGYYHSVTVSSLVNLLNLLLIREDSEQAETVLQGYLEKVKSASNNPLIDGLYEAFSDTDGKQETLRLTYFCYDKCADTLGTTHPRTLELLFLFGYFLFEEDRYQESYVVMTSCLELRRTTLGEDHQDTILTNEFISMSYNVEDDNET